ncbi:uncharacterized protein LOC111374004 [Olea europaea var. sylvestris]|uniref:uncharacterized protein LOC111374004 n=1 Tax=Olea europaea var. sylvestris TaxID=158386 RepID=UPI000C1D71CC|nr:uncharacterized protein LOC111374004 [Olea europaea var. sylvestris]
MTPWGPPVIIDDTVISDRHNRHYADASINSLFSGHTTTLFIAKDVIFCFYCYLFKPNSEEHGGGDSFIDGGFSNWKKKERFQIHVGKSGSAHNRARIKYEAFVNQKQNIDCVLFKKSKKTKDEYRIRLNASVDCVRLLLRQGFSFHGHDESENSRNQGNFLEFLQWLCDHNKEIKDVCLSNAPENLQLTSPKIQKDIVSAIAFETLDVIMRDIGDRLFSILVDESRDVSVKEQMSVVLRYYHSSLKRLEVVESLNLGEISSGKGLNQETTLKRPGDTRWGSHYNSLLNLIIMFSATVDVVEMIATDDTSCGKRGEARILLGSMLTFDFVFSLHLMKKVLGISDELSKSLQMRDQDIVNAMKLVKISKERLQAMRDNEWKSFLRTVSCFCERYNIDVPNMDDMFIPLGRSRRNTQEITNLHHFHVDFFYAIIDMQIQELNDRFSEP